MAINVTVGGVQLPSPSEFSIDYNPITSDAGRLLNGNLALEKGINHKHTITLSYDVISKEDLATIMGLTWTKYKTDRRSIVSTVTFEDIDGSIVTMKAYFAPFSANTRSGLNRNGMWSSVKFKFIEL